MSIYAVCGLRFEDNLVLRWLSETAWEATKQDIKYKYHSSKSRELRRLHASGIAPQPVKPLCVLLIRVSQWWYRRSMTAIAGPRCIERVHFRSDMRRDSISGTFIPRPIGSLRTRRFCDPPTLADRLVISPDFQSALLPKLFSRLLIYLEGFSTLPTGDDRKIDHRQLDFIN